MVLECLPEFGPNAKRENFDDNAAVLLTPTEEVVLPHMPKRAMAHRILDHLKSLRTGEP